MEVVNSTQKTVRLGSQIVGQTVARTIAIVNRSPNAVVISLSLTARSTQLQDTSVLKLDAPNPLFLAPPSFRFGKKVEQPVKVRLTFTPTSRMTQFSEEVCTLLLPWYISRLTDLYYIDR